MSLNSLEAIKAIKPSGAIWRGMLRMRNWLLQGVQRDTSWSDHCLSHKYLANWTVLSISGIWVSSKMAEIHRNLNM